MRTSTLSTAIGAVFAVATLVSVPSAAAKTQTVITVATMDLTAGELLLSGDAFGPDPEVYLGQSLGALSQLALVSHGNNEILATLPAGTSPGTYMVVVLAGSGNSKMATLDVTGGAVGPQGPAGPQGPVGTPGADGADGDDGLPHSKSELYQVIETSDPCGSGEHCAVQAFCNDANDIPINGVCLDLASSGIVFAIRAMIDFDSPSTPASYGCSGFVPVGESTIAQVQLICVAVP